MQEGVCVCVCAWGVCVSWAHAWAGDKSGHCWHCCWPNTLHAQCESREKRGEKRAEAERQQAQPETEMYTTCTVVTEICHRSAMATATATATKGCLISNINK